MQRWALSHVRRTTVEFANLCLNRDLFFRSLGALNARTGLIESVFLAYPGSEKYALAYAYPWRVRIIRWNPYFCGFLLQDRRLTVMFAIASHDDHFRDPGNTDELRRLVERVEKLRVLIGARQKTFAGVLPGILARHGILGDAPEGDITAALVIQAIDNLTPDSHETPPVIVLGGDGFVGRRLVSQLRARGSSVYSVDPVSGGSWPAHLEGHSAIIVNVANRDALKGYLDRLWPEALVLNEVYPEPHPDVIDHLTQQGIALHHVVGVKARAFPPLPAAYAGAIPCCAAWPNDEAAVVTRHLNQGTGVPAHRASR